MSFSIFNTHDRYLLLCFFGFILLVTNATENSILEVQHMENCLVNSPNATILGCFLCSPKMNMIAKKFNYSRRLIEPSPSEVFSKIYSVEAWGPDGGGSGGGSTIEYAVVAHQILQLLTYKYNVKNFIDAPCGHVAQSWMRHTLLSLRQQIPCFHYYGVDVASKIIDDNIKSFGESHSWIKFLLVDLSSANASLPIGYDMIFSRDALQHLSFHNIAGVIRTFCRNDAKYLLVGSYLKSAKENVNIETGGYFDIDLLRPPFSFPQPIEIFSETPLHPNVIKACGVAHSKQYYLYDLQKLCESSTLQHFVATYA